MVQDEATKSCDDAARERGLETRQIVKSLIIESEGRKFHVLLPGNRELSEKKLGSEYRMIPPEESREITGFKSGTVHPFSTQLDHVVDQRIFENEKVSHTVGEKKRGVIIDAEKFRNAIEAADFPVEVRDIAVSTEKDYKQIESLGLDGENARFVVNKGYRKLFKELTEENRSERVLNTIKAFHREEEMPDIKTAQEILNRAESQTHMQRMVEEYVETGELPEKEDFSLEEKVDKVLEENPEAVQDLEDGKDSAMNYIIGQLMQETNGSADAGKARQMVEEKL